MPWGNGVPLAWDNVSATSASLGYVVANHQTSSVSDGPGVLTWYQALSQGDPVAQRKALLPALCRNGRRLWPMTFWP
jgi:hypothetical protein